MKLKWALELNEVFTWLNRLCEKCLCVCSATVYPHANKKPSYLPHFPWLFLFIHATAFSILYSSGIAGNNSTFQFLRRGLCVLANCKIFGNGKRLWLSQCYQWRNYYGRWTLKECILFAAYFIAVILFVITATSDRRKLYFPLNTFRNSEKYTETRWKVKIMKILCGSKILKISGFD